MRNFYYLQQCRLCFCSQLKHRLHLERSPLANNFTDGSVKQEYYDLDVLECQDCGHCQLSVVVNPEMMFKNYLFVSGTSKLTRDHFSQYSSSIIDDFNLTEKDLVVDIGSNDGLFLKFLQENKIKTLGIEPATNLAMQCINEGIDTINDFFNDNVVDKIIDKYGKASIVTANNVFAHSDKLHEIIKNVKKILAAEGVFIFEVGYLVDVINKVNFPTIYHEHTSYHSVGPLLSFLKILGMKVFKIENNGSQDGSIRVYASHVASSHKIDINSITNFLIRENDIGLIVPPQERSSYKIGNKNCASAWYGFRNSIENAKRQVRDKLEEIHNKGGQVIGYGAAAKSTTFLSNFGINQKYISAIIDENPLKIGKKSPIDNIPIVSKKELYKNVSSSTIYKPKYECCMILSCNFADSIIENNKEYISSLWRGTFAVPLPELKEYK